MARNRLVIVQHHHVGWPPPAARYRRMFTTPALLAFQVRLFRLAGYRFLTLADAVAAPGKRAVVTFDDGHRDYMEVAAELLGRLGVPATVFVVSADVGKTQVRWEESGDRLPGDLCGWDDLQRLQDRGWEIGSHGHRHVHLARRLPDEQAEDVRVGRETVEQRLVVAPRSFAYPYGSFNDATVEAVGLAGFACAVTAIRGGNGRDANPYRLRRQAGGGRRIDHFARSFRLLA